MPYTIEFTRAALKAFDALPRKQQQRISGTLDLLEQSPRPQSAKKLKGSKVEGLFRVRAGDYRLVYQIKDDVLTVLIVRIGHRRDVYRGL